MILHDLFRSFVVYFSVYKINLDGVPHHLSISADAPDGVFHVDLPAPAQLLLQPQTLPVRGGPCPGIAVSATSTPAHKQGRGVSHREISRAGQTGGQGNEKIDHRGSSIASQSHLYNGSKRRISLVVVKAYAYRSLFCIIL